jgi:GT2 family glycosyltransferase
VSLLRRRLAALRVRMVDLFGGLPRRAYLTVKYRGWRSFVFRAVTFPLRLTPFGRFLGIGRDRTYAAKAKRWYEDEWRPVTIAIPHWGPPEQTVETVKAVLRTTDAERVRVVVSDDASPAPYPEQLRQALAGKAEVILADENGGFSVNANRALRAARPGDDVVLLNSDVVALPGWLESLQHAAYGADDVGIVGPKLLYPDRTIQSAGSHRNLGAPEWFDHRYRFKPTDHGPANVGVPCLAMTGACMYVKRTLIESIGLLDERYPMAYEDVDWCLRAWEAGFRVMYHPPAALFHLESKSRGTDQGERELESQRVFWEQWGDWFDRRQVRTEDGRLRVVYVTEDTGVGGGHRVVFEHLNGLAERGHECELWSLDGPPDWYDLKVPVRRFDDYDSLTEELATVDALKVATWWNTAAPVWNASVRRGIPVYFVQDIETSYYPNHPHVHSHVIATYRQEFHFLTTSQWVAGRLRELGDRPGARYFERPSDAEVNELLNRTTALVQTSRHEGFCLPLLEAMAAGAPVVCTDAHGNRDFCRDGENCLMADEDPRSVREALERLLRDGELRARLSDEGRRTATEYAWPGLIDRVERFFEDLAPTR